MASRTVHECVYVDFTAPKGSFCLKNDNTTERKVGVLPDAKVMIGDKEGSIADLPAFAAAGPSQPMPNKVVPATLYYEKGLVSRIVLEPAWLTEGQGDVDPPGGREDWGTITLISDGTIDDFMLCFRPPAPTVMRIKFSGDLVEVGEFTEYPDYACPEPDEIVYGVGWANALPKDDIVIGEVDLSDGTTRAFRMFLKYPDLDYGDTTSPDVSASQRQTQRPQMQFVSVPNLIGYSNRALRAARIPGLWIATSFNTGDPSIAAQVNGNCISVAQSPRAGSRVRAGSVVRVLLNCPQTGFG